MKKTLIILVAFTSVLVMAGCGNNDDADRNKGNHANTPRELPGDQYKVPNDSAQNYYDASNMHGTKNQN